MSGIRGAEPVCNLCGRPAMMIVASSGAHWTTCARCGADYKLVARPNDTGRLARAVCREMAQAINAPPDSTVEDLLRIIATAELAREECPGFPVAVKAQREAEAYAEAWLRQEAGGRRRGPIKVSYVASCSGGCPWIGEVAHSHFNVCPNCGMATCTAYQPDHPEGQRLLDEMSQHERPHARQGRRNELQRHERTRPRALVRG